VSGTAQTTLSSFLDELFRTMLKDPGRGSEYSYADVANWCVDNQECSFSPEYVRQLRKGIKANPTLNHMTALAAFFGVPASAFIDPESMTVVREQLAELRRERDGWPAAPAEAFDPRRRMEQQRMVARAAGSLPEEKWQLLMSILEAVRQSEDGSDGSGTPGNAS
jgi:transcriptional regulator with XRE-family HTH domain